MKSFALYVNENRAYRAGRRRIRRELLDNRSDGTIRYLCISIVKNCNRWNVGVVWVGRTTAATTSAATGWNRLSIATVDCAIFKVKKPSSAIVAFAPSQPTEMLTEQVHAKQLLKAPAAAPWQEVAPLLFAVAADTSVLTVGL
jgi:hypothetical protein